MKRQVITLFGPTASGKTALAIFLAQNLNGVVVNADSRQIYKNMPIITAMPSDVEFEAADHRLFNFLEVDETFSADKYATLAKAEIEKIFAAGKLPIICGGTGFYLKVLEEGISPVPALETALLVKLNERAKNEGSEVLHAELLKVNPETANRLPVLDVQRIVRALGVFLQEGLPISHFQKLPKQGGLKADFIKLAINPDREWLYERIHQRYDVMMRMGLLAEMKNLERMGYTLSHAGMQSCGAGDVLRYLNNEISEDAMKTAMLQSTRNYAKRQVTWLNGQYKPHLVFKDVAQGQASLFQIEELLNKS